jgi:molybdenum cofactor cytidylyltransferase
LISGVILAAGSSVRLGGRKQLLDVGGAPLLQRVVDAAAGSRLDEVIVVLGHAAGEIHAALDLGDKVRVVVNPDHAQGMSTSLRTGLAAAAPGATAAAILLGDQPDITSRLIDSVVDRFSSCDEEVLRPTFRGVPGHPVVIRRSAWGAAAEARGDEGLRAVLDRVSVEELEMDVRPPRDIDTPEDYRALTQRDPTD